MAPIGAAFTRVCQLAVSSASCVPATMHNQYAYTSTFYTYLICRKDCDFIKHVVKPFDWTYTTDYKGTLLSKEAEIQVNRLS